MSICRQVLILLVRVLTSICCLEKNRPPGDHVCSGIPSNGLTPISPPFCTHVSHHLTIYFGMFQIPHGNTAGLMSLFRPEHLLTEAFLVILIETGPLLYHNNLNFICKLRAGRDPYLLILILGTQKLLVPYLEIIPLFCGMTQHLLKFFYLLICLLLFQNPPHSGM